MASWARSLLNLSMAATEKAPKLPLYPSNNFSVTTRLESTTTPFTIEIALTDASHTRAQEQQTMRERKKYERPLPPLPQPLNTNSDTCRASIDHFSVMQMKLSASAIQSNCDKSPTKSESCSADTNWSSESQRFLFHIWFSSNRCREYVGRGILGEGNRRMEEKLTASRNTPCRRRAGRRGLCLCCCVAHGQSFSRSVSRFDRFASVEPDAHIE